jgi:addiction module HigA family antidote
MKTISRRKVTRKPTTPGDFLRFEFLEPLGLTQKELADHIDCDIKVINRIVNGKAVVTVPVAIKLGAAFKTSAEFWLNAQRAIDLHEAEQSIKKLPTPLLKTS